MTLLELIELLKKHRVFMTVMPLVLALIVGLGSLLLPNRYTATTSMYVLARTEGITSSDVTQTDLSVGQMLSNDVATILCSDRVKNDVAKEFDLEERLEGFDLTIINSTETRVITLAVTGDDPKTSALVADALVADTSRVAVEVMKIESINVIDKADVPTIPSGPPRLRYALAALAGGLMMAVAIIVIRDALDTRIHSATEVEALIGVSVVGQFPVMEGK